MSLLRNNNTRCFRVVKELSSANTIRCCSAITVRQKSSSSKYLHESIVPTDHFQRSLPRLPIPKLEKTCKRYLESQGPILGSEEYEKTKSYVDNFLNGQGKDLDAELIAINKANKHTSYISAMCFDMYLRDRRPVVLNQNPFMSFKFDSKPEYNDQAIRAANMCITAARFRNSLKANNLEPQVYHLVPEKSDNEKFRKFTRLLPKAISWFGAYWYKAFPLDMSQHKNLFNSTRVPRQDLDEIFLNESGKHVFVIRNGHYYTFDLVDDNGNVSSPSDVLANIQNVLSDTRPPPQHSLGYCTGGERNAWAKTREDLIQNGNQEQLAKIDSALFVLCLDDESPGNTDVKDTSRVFLYGNGANRWFDKSFSLIVCKNGNASINMEHAWGDGVAVLYLFNELYRETTTSPFVHPHTQPSTSKVQNIEFNYDDTIRAAIDKFKDSYNSTTNGLEVAFLEYKKFGKEFLKAKKISPDALMQMLFQVAYYKQHGKVVGSYESCSTAAFKHGRTECIRPATMETFGLSKMLASKNKSVSLEEMREQISKCSNKHGSLTKNAAMGQGFDRHLFALKNLAQGRGIMPDIFKDPAYTFINQYIISTSTLSSPGINLGGFGPVLPNGYGIGYGIDENRLGCNVSYYPSHSNASDFVQLVEESVDQIYNVLEGKEFR